MKDKVVCTDDKCPIRGKCKRFVDRPGIKDYAYFVGSPREGSNCRFYEEKK